MRNGCENATCTTTHFNDPEMCQFGLPARGGHRGSKALTQCFVTLLVFVVSNLTLFKIKTNQVSFTLYGVFDTRKTFCQNVFPMHTAHALSYERWHFSLGLSAEASSLRACRCRLCLSTRLSTSIIALQSDNISGFRCVTSQS